MITVREYLRTVRGVHKANWRVLYSLPHYELLMDEKGSPAIRCLRCRQVSCLKNDVLNHYCGFCRQFLDEIADKAAGAN
jgi:cytidine deaminase